MLKFIVLLTLLPMFFTYVLAEDISGKPSGYYDSEDRDKIPGNLSALKSDGYKKQMNNVDKASEVNKEGFKDNNLDRTGSYIDSPKIENAPYPSNMEGKAYKKNQFSEVIGRRVKNTNSSTKKNKTPEKKYDIINGNKIERISYDIEPKAETKKNISKIGKINKKVKAPVGGDCKKAQQFINKQEQKFAKLADGRSQANAGQLFLLLMIQAHCK